jgi:hypothetical protein
MGGWHNPVISRNQVSSFTTSIRILCSQVDKGVWRCALSGVLSRTSLATQRRRTRIWKCDQERCAFFPEVCRAVAEPYTPEYCDKTGGVKLSHPLKPPEGVFQRDDVPATIDCHIIDVFAPLMTRRQPGVVYDSRHRHCTAFKRRASEIHRSQMAIPSSPTSSESSRPRSKRHRPAHHP